MNREEIIGIFDKYISRKASDEEIEKIRDFIRTDRDFSVWLEHQIEESEGELDEDTSERMLDAIRSEIGRQRKHTRYIQLMKWAAMIAIPLVLCTSLYFNFAKEPAMPFVIAANRGDKAHVTLSDGTKLNINSASKVKYYSDYNIEERKVALDGEAYFDVKHDKTKPFTVTCGDISITVLGTTFGIKDYSYDSYISVVLRTGKILLQTPTEKINMHPNEKVVYNKITGKTETSEVEADDYVNWMNDQLRFDNETLGNIVRAISNMHNVNIVFADNKLKDMHYTGTLNSKTVDDALNMITQTSPIRYKQKDGKIILYHK